MSKPLKGRIQEYSKLYENIPNELNERLRLLLKPLVSRNTDKIKKLIKMNLERFKTVKRREVSFTLYLTPEPTPRPRLSGGGRFFYVRGAAENSALFKKIVDDIQTLPIITTATEITVKSFLPIPSGMNRLEKLFAEMGFVHVYSTPDWDNLAKAYCDMIQKHLLLNDSLIWKGTSSKHYSTKPRIEMTIRYDTAYDCNFNKRKVESSKFFLEGDCSRYVASTEVTLQKTKKG